MMQGVMHQPDGLSGRGSSTADSGRAGVASDVLRIENRIEGLVGLGKLTIPAFLITQEEGVVAIGPKQPFRPRQGLPLESDVDRMIGRRRKGRRRGYACGPEVLEGRRWDSYWTREPRGVHGVDIALDMGRQNRILLGRIVEHLDIRGTDAGVLGPALRVDGLTILATKLVPETETMATDMANPTTSELGAYVSGKVRLHARKLWVPAKVLVGL
jgi:hypothetical protein